MMADLPRLSIILPVLNEAPGLVAALQALAPLRCGGAEVIVVDGGSGDRSAELAATLADISANLPSSSPFKGEVRRGMGSEAAEFTPIPTPALPLKGREKCSASVTLELLPLADQVLAAPRGRASQMNAGAAAARGGVLLFLHADTRLPEGAAGLMTQAVAAGHHWGRFDVRIEGESAWLPLVAAMMNRRSRLTGIATGDQAIFVARDAFVAVGGYPDIPLMEDIALSRRLLRSGRPASLAARVTTSGRRWEAQGVWRTIRRMWWLRLRYALGADPRRLALEYGYAPRET